MSDKVIAIMDKPRDCENCVFGVCKYSTPLSTRVKGYTCQLKPVEDRLVDCFDYDSEVHLENCPLVSAEEYDKEIRDKAIEEFSEKLKERCDSMISEKWNSEVAPISWADAYADFKDDIAEQMRQQEKGGYNE